MSIVEQLHQKIDELTEEQQAELLYTVEQWLGQESQPDDEREELIKAVLAQRLENRQQNRAKARPFDDVMDSLNRQHGWE